LAPLTKASLAQALFELELLPKKEAAQVVESLISLMKETLAAGEPLLISGFGKWTVKNKKSRQGRNPRTGALLKIQPRRVVTFKPSGTLRRRLNT
jgi:integration host factor subunit alpha